METITPDQAAKILQVTPATIRRWLRNGEIGGSDTPAGWRLTQADIQTWLDKYRKPVSASTPPAAQATAAEGDAPAVDWD